MKALNLAGCGEEQQIFCFTQEGGTCTVHTCLKYSGRLILCMCGCQFLAPPVPKNVTVIRINDTAMMVSWHKFTLVELQGFAAYIITYTVGGGSRKRQNNQMVTAMWFENNKTIGGLPPGQAVDVQVRTNSSGGRSGELFVHVAVYFMILPL